MDLEKVGLMEENSPLKAVAWLRVVEPVEIAVLSRIAASTAPSGTIVLPRIFLATK
jgi:hypothetical protein